MLPTACLCVLGIVPCFFGTFVTERDVSDVQCNTSDENHRRGALPAGSGKGVTRQLIAG